MLPAHAPIPSSSSIDIVITSSKDSINLTDITFGEVLLCGGQSNMAITVRMAMNATYEISRSDIPELRLFAGSKLRQFWNTKYATGKHNYVVAVVKIFAERYPTLFRCLLFYWQKPFCKTYQQV